MGQSVQREKEAMRTIQVCGIRDGLRFCFDVSGEPDLQKRCDYAEKVVLKKAEKLSDLLKSGAFIELSGVQLGEMQRLALEQKLSEMLHKEVRVRIHAFKGHLNLRESKTHFGTLRSGMSISAEGDLTVVGDVHAGARIEAGGSIMVLGVLSGTALAGKDGNTDASVSAWGLDAAQIGIADVLSAKPSTRNLADRIPETAFLKNGELKIRKYNDKI